MDNNNNNIKGSQESQYRRVKTRLRHHLQPARNMRCFKDLILACVAPHKRKQVAPKVSPSPPAPTSQGPVFSRAPSAARKASFVAEPVTLTRTFSQFNGDTEGVRHLHRAASMGARSHRAAAFAASKTMSSKDMRRSQSHTETPRMQRSLSRSHHQPIVFSTSSGLLRPLQVEQMLECTLDELCFECVKQIEVSRAVVTLTGLMSEEEELLKVNVNPGWKKGTTITFPGEEDKETGSHSADIVFVVVEKEHDRLKRQEGNEEDLEVEIGLPLVDAISGCNLKIPLLGGGQIILFSDDIIEPGFERVLQGQGMPKKKHPTERGDLKIKFHVEFPNSLTDSQRSEIVQILSD